MKICVLGAGAFGTALACVLAEKHDVALWGRSSGAMANMQASRQNTRLPDVTLPSAITCTSNAGDALDQADYILSAIPLQATADVLCGFPQITSQQVLIGCSKGFDIARGTGGYSTLTRIFPNNPVGVLTGPSFAVDIAAGKPTALLLAGDAEQPISRWQDVLSGSTLRLYTSHDPIGAEMGGALKNVMAIASGIAMGAGLGESARAALITRGYAEMKRYAMQHGAAAQTLSGLSGFGDLCLTATSEKSRNYRFGMALGQGEAFGSAITVEGRHTAQALANMIPNCETYYPITFYVAQLCAGRANVSDVLANLMNRPLKEEF